MDSKKFINAMLMMSLFIAGVLVGAFALKNEMANCQEQYNYCRYKYNNLIRECQPNKELMDVYNETIKVELDIKK